MAPTVSWRSGSKPRKAELADGTLEACKTAAAHADFANFTTMEIRNSLHTSQSDMTNHATVRVKTTTQTTDGKHQVAHIYIDKTTTETKDAKGKVISTTTTYTYTSHVLYGAVKAD